MKNTIKNIIWDWNGTLLNDTGICIEGINLLLKRRSLPILEEQRYKEIFTFPVRDYYQAAGFDFGQEPFQVPAEEFIIEYKKILDKASLFYDVKATITELKIMGVRQFVLSAMEQKALNKCIEDHGIDDYFEGIYGISDNLAASKIARGYDLFKAHNLDTQESLFVGDTLHDVEVARELGVDIILIGRGHQHKERLNGHKVKDDLDQLMEYVLPMVNG